MNKNKLIGIIILVSGCLQLQAQKASFEFTENKGQWEEAVKFRGDFPTGSFFLHSNGFTVLQHHAEDLANIRSLTHYPINKSAKDAADSMALKKNEIVVSNTNGSDYSIRSHAYRVRFENASPNASIQSEKTVDGYVNYLLGNDPDKWASHVKQYMAVTYKNIYAGIDLRYYSQDGQLKYDFIVQPGADPSQIIMNYDGQEGLRIERKELFIKTSVNEVRELFPYSYQPLSAGGRKEVDCQFVIEGGNKVRFKLGKRDASLPLVIDPTLVFASFSGGGDNYAFTATPGPDGSLFSGGIVFRNDFPATVGAFQTSFKGGSKAGKNHPTDIGIIKFNTTGTRRVYTTYLGGTDNEFPHSLFCDPTGNLVIMGRTYSNDFPKAQQYGKGGQSDIIVAKLNSDGSNLTGSLKIGGTSNDGVNIKDQYTQTAYFSSSICQNYGDESRSEVVLDANGFIYVAANSESLNFPVTAGAFQQTKGTGQDGVVMKISPDCKSLVWASYLGGNGDDGAFVLDISPITGNIYVGGATVSTNFPVTSGVLQGSFAGGPADGFIAELPNDGSKILTCSYLGTALNDIVYGVKFDKKGFPYVMGTTHGSWTVVNAPYFNNGGKQFISKLKPDLTGYVYSTVFGTNNPKPNMSPIAFLVDRCENVYVSGWGGDGGLYNGGIFDLAGVDGMPTTVSRKINSSSTRSDNMDLYFIVIKKNAAGLLYGGYFGQDGGLAEHVDGGTSRFDAQGAIYQAICSCVGGKGALTTPGVVAPYNTSGACNLLAIKIAFNFAGVSSGVQAQIDGVKDTLGCVPLKVDFIDTVNNGTQFVWYYNDGSKPDTTTSASSSHVFNQVGDYRVKLVSLDPSSCNERDSSYITISVRDNKVLMSPIEASKEAPCSALNYSFKNLSVAPAGRPFLPNSFEWDFGDGSKLVTGGNNVQHTYSAPGTYKVSLTLIDPAYCNSPEKKELLLWVAPKLKAAFDNPGIICAPDSLHFKNSSQGGNQFEWLFSDDNTKSTAANPTHYFKTPGTYTVYLRAVETGSCPDTAYFELPVSVKPTPIAAMDHNPKVPAINQAIVFSNYSTGASSYLWDFGDNDSLQVTTMANISHLYNLGGEYYACLKATNTWGCIDTACALVEAKVEALLDVPNAFTPGKQGPNSTIYAIGFGIRRFNWKIYNRWGQLVFETNDRKVGWDGSFKGKPLPMDVYAYVLAADFTTGETVLKKGDITLIR